MTSHQDLGRFWTAFAFALCVGTASSGRADIATDDCSAPGQACMNYRTQETGACVESKCTRSRPGPDGGIVTREYECLECVHGAKVTDGKAGEGGAGGKGGAGGHGGSGKNSGAATGSSSDSGCSAIPGTRKPMSLLVVSAGLSLLWLRVGRRRPR